MISVQAWLRIEWPIIVPKVCGHTFTAIPFGKHTSQEHWKVGPLKVRAGFFASSSLVGRELFALAIPRIEHIINQVQPAVRKRHQEKGRARTDVNNVWIYSRRPINVE